MAVTDRAAGKRGICAFLVPTDTPGYIVARLEDKIGQHASDTAQILFENCRVPAANLIGEPGAGYRIALVRPRRRPHRHRLAVGRHGARRRSRPRSPTRASARPSASRSSSTRRCSSGWPTWRPQIEAARQLIAHAARLKDAGLPCLKEAAMAKLFASEMAERVCSDAIQVHGGYGYVSDFPVERIYRDVRVCQIYEGTSDIQKILIGRALAAG